MPFGPQPPIILCFVVLLTSGAGCFPHHLRIGVVDTSVGARYDCSDAKGCARLKEADPDIISPGLVWILTEMGAPVSSDLTHIDVRTRCPHGMSSLTVQAPGGSKAQAVVTCRGAPSAASEVFSCSAEGCTDDAGFISLHQGERSLTRHLPYQCKHEIHQIIVLDAGSEAPRIVVTCDQPDMDINLGASQDPPGVEEDPRPDDV